MSRVSDWGTRPMPVISYDLILSFLAYVHNFTSVGLEAQATAFSYKNDGIVRYLALLPQVNAVDTVTTADTMISELNAIEKFASDESKNVAFFRDWCWCIVVSPRREGIKVLCVHLTEKGFEKLDNYRELAGDSGMSFQQYASMRINASQQEYYCQIPFTISSVPS